MGCEGIGGGGGGWRAGAQGFTSRDLGLVINDPVKIGAIGVLGAASIAGLQWLNLRRMGRSSSPLRTPLQALAERILPRSRLELIPFFALAVSARGFGGIFLPRFSPPPLLLPGGFPWGDPLSPPPPFWVWPPLL